MYTISHGWGYKRLFIIEPNYISIYKFYCKICIFITYKYYHFEYY